MEFTYYLVCLFCFVGVYFGVKSFASLSDFFKAILVQATIYGLFFLFNFFLGKYQESTENRIDNLIFINFHTGVEAILLFIGAFSALKSNLEKGIFYTLFGIFLIFWLFHLIFLGPYDTSDMSDLAACITLMLTFTILLFRQISYSKIRWLKSPEILTTMGILLYFAGSVPFVAMTNYIAKNDVDLYILMYYFINVGLANLRYLLLALSFYLIWKHKGKNLIDFTEQKVSLE